MSYKKYLSFQVRDSLAQTLNTEILETIQKLDKIGKSAPTLFQKGEHVAHVDIPANADEQYSTSTSGIYSVDGSEGSNSPEYNSFRNRVTCKDRDMKSNKRCSVGLSGDSDNIARLIVGEMSQSCESSDKMKDFHNIGIPPPKPSRQFQGRGVNMQNLQEKFGTDNAMSTESSCQKQKVERSNSRVSRVSNIIRWPKKQEKERSGLSVVE